MDSINRQQPEENHEDLQGREAIKKMKALCEKAGNCFFCTKISTGGPFATRPMALQQIDEEGSFWFLSATDSYKNAEIATDPAVQMLFQGSSYSDFVNVYGKASITQDKARIKELWNKFAEIWFQEGPDDPDVTLIAVRPQQARYWDTKHNKVVQWAKMAAAMVTGKTMDDGREGTLKP